LDLSVAQALETAMKKKVLLIVGIAAAVVLAGGFTFAQMRPHGPGGFGPPFMHGNGPGGFGPPFMRDMGAGGMGPGGMGPGMMAMGPGTMGMGPGMMGMAQDSATRTQLRDIHALLANHDRIKRTVTNLPNGIRTATESDDPQIAALIKAHVTAMGERVKAGDDPGLPIETPSLHAIFRDKDKINTSYETTAKGVLVVQTSNDSKTVAALQRHASEVTDLVNGGMAALRTAMMQNHGGMMGGMMHGPMMHSGPGDNTAPDAR
jgi:hypothetical protein